MRIELKDLIKRVGITSIYVTHDQVEAMAISDRIVLMDRGKIVQFGNARELYERPSTGFIAEFLGSINFLQARVAESRGSERDSGLVKAVFENGCEILFPAPPSLPAREVTLGLRPEHLQLYKEFMEKPNLWQAVVKKQVYMGSIIQVFAEIGQSTFRIQTSLEISQEGETIFLGIDPQRVIYIP
jgi:iron(III) transport system ATP-binding protein